MPVNRFEKTIYEEFAITGDFLNNMETGEAITAASASAKDALEQDATSAVLDVGGLSFSGTKVIVGVKGGDKSKSPYDISITCTTSSTPQGKWEIKIKMHII